MDESENDLNQLMTAGGDMQSKIANPYLQMASPDSVCLNTESGTNTANVTLEVEDSSSTKPIEEEKPIRDKK